MYVFGRCRLLTELNGAEHSCITPQEATMPKGDEGYITVLHISNRSIKGRGLLICCLI